MEHADKGKLQMLYIIMAMKEIMANMNTYLFIKESHYPFVITFNEVECLWNLLFKSNCKAAHT